MKQSFSGFQDNRDPVAAPNHDRPDKQRRTAGEGTPIDRSTLAAAEKASRKLARSHYENFLVATVLLPRRLRQPFYNIYAFCRTADDLADESPSPADAMAGLHEFQQRLDDTFRGQPPDHLFLALSHTIDQFRLPKEPFDDLLEAFRQDQIKRSYANFDELLDYCRRSANPVGRLVLRLGGCFDDDRAEQSDQICTGLQLANFWQDVARDHAIGRVYLPADGMESFGVTAEMLSAGSTPPPLRELLRSECDRAEQYFRRGLPLADQVPRWFAGDIRLFAHGGLATLDAIRGIDFDVLAQRPTVGKARQLWMVAKATVGLL